MSDYWHGALVVFGITLGVIFCLLTVWLITAELIGPPRRRPLRVQPPHDPTYDLADNIDVPLIEVVLDAEARADPNYWTPKTWADALRPSPRLPDPYERAHDLLNSPPTTAAPRPTRPSPARELGGW